MIRVFPLIGKDRSERHVPNALVCEVSGFRHVPEVRLRHLGRHARNVFDDVVRPNELVRSLDE